MPWGMKEMEVLLGPSWGPRAEGKVSSGPQPSSAGGWWFKAQQLPLRDEPCSLWMVQPAPRGSRVLWVAEGRRAAPQSPGLSLPCKGARPNVQALTPEVSLTRKGGQVWLRSPGSVDRFRNKGSEARKGGCTPAPRRLRQKGTELRLCLSLCLLF